MGRAMYGSLAMTFGLVAGILGCTATGGQTHGEMEPDQIDAMKSSAELPEDVLSQGDDDDYIALDLVSDPAGKAEVYSPTCQLFLSPEMSGIEAVAGAPRWIAVDNGGTSPCILVEAKIVECPETCQPTDPEVTFLKLDTHMANHIDPGLRGILSITFVPPTGPMPALPFNALLYIYAVDPSKQDENWCPSPVQDPPGDTYWTTNFTVHAPNP